MCCLVTIVYYVLCIMYYVNVFVYVTTFHLLQIQLTPVLFDGSVFRDLRLPGCKGRAAAFRVESSWAGGPPL